RLANGWSRSKPVSGDGYQVVLVPKLCLGMRCGEAPLRSPADALRPGSVREAELPDPRSQAELGNEKQTPSMRLAGLRGDALADDGIPVPPPPTANDPADHVRVGRGQ